jgi:hypothetical protein
MSHSSSKPYRNTITDKYGVPASHIDELNIRTINHVLEFLQEFIFAPLLRLTRKLKDIPTSKHKDSIREIKILLSKLSTIIDVYPYASTAPKDDLFSLDRSHPEWLKIYPKV